MNEQSPARCTCPTGDGSLEHPCPAHLTECAPGAINLIDALLENPAIPMAAKARLRNIRGTVVALHERAPKDHGFDFVAHLERQKRFSAHTFGPGARARGIVDHIRKELLEVEADPGDLCEWVDVAILALDGAWRSGATPQEIAAAIVTKQAKNESRVWPHWSTMPADKAIEHDRSGETPRSTPAAPGIDPADPWRGLYAPELMPKLDGINGWAAVHPDLPQWPDPMDEERALDPLVKAQGFAFAVVDGDYGDDDCGPDEFDTFAWLANSKPEPPVGEHWRLVMVHDTEDGPAAVFVRPLAVIDAAPVATAPVDTWFADQLTAMGEVTPLASTPAAPGIDLTVAEVGVIEALLALAYAVWNVADNGEDHGESLTIERSDFAAVEKALDALDELPDDQPGYTLEVAAKARWALRRLLGEGAGSLVAAPPAVPDNEAVRSILGRPNFACRDIAMVLRAGGDTIDHRSENEQAAVLRFMLNHYLADPIKWPEPMLEELQAIRAAAQAKDGVSVGNLAVPE